MRPYFETYFFLGDLPNTVVCQIEIEKGLEEKGLL